MEFEKEIIKRMQASRDRLIREYMNLQDRMDEMNSQIFDLCCEIESINQEIAVVRKTAEDNGHPLNGKMDPREVMPLPPPPDNTAEAAS